MYLVIPALDSLTYALTADALSMTIKIVYEKHHEKARIDFYCKVNAALISHEKSGNNIIVRLVKKSPAIWPNLTSEPNRFCRASFDDMPTFINESLEIRNFHGRPASDFDGEDATEFQDNFDTFEPI